MLGRHPQGGTGSCRADRGSKPLEGQPRLCRPVGMTWSYDQPARVEYFMRVDNKKKRQTVLGSKKLWSRGSCPATSCSCQDWNSRRRQGQGIYAKNIKEKFYTESWHWLTTLLQSMMRRFLKESQTNLLLKKWSSIPM